MTNASTGHGVRRTTAAVVTTGAALASLLITLRPAAAAATACSVVRGTAPATLSADGISLNLQQSTNAIAAVQAARLLGLTQRDAAIALMTAYDESGIRRLSNAAVPESANYPHDGTGADHSSVGMFQQQPQYYTDATIATLMDAAGAAGEFDARLVNVPDRATKTLWAVAQEVQNSGTPDGSNYARYAQFGTDLAAQLWSSSSSVVVDCAGRVNVTSRVAGDFTGDGKADYALWNTKTGHWAINHVDKGAYGGVGDIPVPADYNGDGNAEVAVYRASKGTWYAAGKTVQTGGPDWVPVPADFDGDGKADYALWNTKTGHWAINHIDKGAYGGAGDIPVPADYNGDGKAEIAVYRPSTGTWYADGKTVQTGGPGWVPAVQAAPNAVTLGLLQGS